MDNDKRQIGERIENTEEQYMEIHFVVSSKLTHFTKLATTCLWKLLMAPILANLGSPLSVIMGYR